MKVLFLVFAIVLVSVSLSAQRLSDGEILADFSAKDGRISVVFQCDSANVALRSNTMPNEISLKPIGSNRYFVSIQFDGLMKMGSQTRKNLGKTLKGQTEFRLEDGILTFNLSATVLSAKSLENVFCSPRIW